MMGYTTNFFYFPYLLLLGMRFVLLFLVFLCVSSVSCLFLSSGGFVYIWGDGCEA
jgi:hypothetical protein